MKKHENLTLLQQEEEKIRATCRAENIYYLNTLGKLALFENRINQIAAETGLNVAAAIKEAGIKSPFDLLEEAIAHWDSLLESRVLPPEEELVKQLSGQFRLKIKRVKIPYVPVDTDTLFQPGITKNDTSPEIDINRVALTLETVLHMEIAGKKPSLDDLDITVSVPPPNSGRRRPYWSIVLKEQKIVILVNNEYGNRTFVISFKNKKHLHSIQTATKKTNKELQERGEIIHHFKCENPEQFKKELASAITHTIEQIRHEPYYATLAEASLAAKSLGITSAPEYKKRRHLDPRLPSAPHATYQKDWTDWHSFLGKPKLYETYAEAKNAAQNLGVKNYTEYLSEHHKDPRLPLYPKRVYSREWIGWDDFLGRKP